MIDNKWQMQEKRFVKLFKLLDSARGGGGGGTPYILYGTDVPLE